MTWKKFLSFLWKAKREITNRGRNASIMYIVARSLFFLEFPWLRERVFDRATAEFHIQHLVGGSGCFSLHSLFAPSLGRDVGFEDLGMSKYVAVALLTMSIFFGGSGCAEANSTKGPLRCAILVPSISAANVFSLSFAPAPRRHPTLPHVF